MAHTSAKALQSPFVVIHTSRLNMPAFFFIKAHALFPEKLTKMLKNALSQCLRN